MDAFISRELRGVDRAVRRKEADLAHSSVSVGRHRTGAVRRRKFTARRRTAARPPAWWLVVSCATRTPPGALWSRSAARNASRQKM
jgi:hypothetical protein